MHITTKDVVANKSDQEKYPDSSLPVGTHILTSILEGDGPVALCSDTAKFDAKVISAKRTDSGGIQVQTAVTVLEPASVSTASGPNADALRYLISKGFSPEDSAAHLDKFGSGRILAQRDKDVAEENVALDEEAQSAFGGRPTVDSAKNSQVVGNAEANRAAIEGENPRGNETQKNWDEARAAKGASASVPMSSYPLVDPTNPAIAYAGQERRSLAELDATTYSGPERRGGLVRNSRTQRIS
jgi:hypothetical protein